MNRGDFTNRQIRLRCHIRCRHMVRERMGRIFGVNAALLRVLEAVNG